MPTIRIFADHEAVYIEICDSAGKMTCQLGESISEASTTATCTAVNDRLQQALKELRA